MSEKKGLKIGHKTEARTEDGLTIAERDKIDQVISALSNPEKKRALRNIKTQYIIDELARRTEVKQNIVANCYTVISEYQEKDFDINVMEEFIEAMKGALNGLSRC